MESNIPDDKEVIDKERIDRFLNNPLGDWKPEVTVTDEQYPQERSQENYNNEILEDNNLESDQNFTEEDNSPDGEETAEVEAKKSKSKKYLTKKRDREEKYQLTQQLALEKKRNLELQNYLSVALNNHTKNNATQAIAELEVAERMHAEALENGDALSVSKATTRLTQANMNLERVANQRLHEEQDNYTNINPNKEAAGYLLQDWLVENPEFNEDSRKFDPNLFNKVATEVDNLEKKLKRRGEAHLISSPIYFDILDTIVSEIKAGSRKDHNRPVNAELGRNYSRPMTAPVNSRSYTRQSNMNSEGAAIPRLSEDLRRAAMALNIPEQQYAKIYMENMKKTKEQNYDY